MNVSQRFHDVLAEKKVPHIWQIEEGAHTMAVWKNDLYLFSQRLFRDAAVPAKVDAPTAPAVAPAKPEQPAP